MHIEALQWLDACRARLSVCDLGSYQVNGTAKDHVNGWNYTGVDIRPGPGVTVVADAADFDADGRVFDVVISCEMFEHCPRWREVVTNAFRLTKPGGHFWGTAAGPNRPAHTSDGGTVTEKDYYANIDPDEMKTLLAKAGFVQIVVDCPPDRMDVRWYAQRPYQKPLA
jgi:SAM-dependent methyltransferase